MNSIIDCLEHWTAVQPDKCFSSFLGIDGKERETYTYLTFHERTSHLAEYLFLQMNLKRGDRALLVYPPGLEIIVAFIACARAGVIPVPVSPPILMGFEGGLAKLAVVARDCQATTALTTTSFYRSYQQLLTQRRVASFRQKPSEQPTLDWVTTDDVRGEPSDGFRNDSARILFLQYTSGSTSDPKGVIVRHENVIHNARSTLDHTPIGVSWLPQCHDMGLIGYYLFPLITGGTTYGFSPTDFLKRPLLWLQTISRVRATYASSPNFGFEYCLREDKIPSEQLSEIDLSSLRVLMNAADSVQANTYRRFIERFATYGLRPQAHVVAYGLAENTLAVTNCGRRIVTVDKRLLEQGTVQIAGAHLPKDQLSFASCGAPLDGIQVRIVNPESRAILGQKQIGEIWVAGKSTCAGYWNRPEQTRAAFANAVANDPKDRKFYLRTGDLGFLEGNELFVCGRIKDLIIIRGIKYYPQDIEILVESASRQIRSGGVAAFNGDQEEETLIVLAEVKSRQDLPDPAQIARAIRTRYYIEPHRIVFVPRGAIAKTTSGKIARGMTRRRWLNGELPTIATHLNVNETEGTATLALMGRFRYLLERFNLTGQEEHTFVEIGMDSLSLVTLLMDIERFLEEHGAGELIDEVDARLLQRLTVAEFFAILGRFDKSDAPIATLRHLLQQIKQGNEVYERDCMQSDAHLDLINQIEVLSSDEALTNVLLTGPTGFFGPFLLSSLLTRTPYTYYALTRSAHPEHGMERIRASLRRARVWTRRLDEELERRVHVVCGDIAQPDLGLCSRDWKSLSTGINAVFHNAARVNYVLNYDALRPPNVCGTRELLRFAYTGIQKEFHFISSTIIFGWTVKETLLEVDKNDAMANLDFGYAQSKWVAEQLVFEAGRKGLKVCVYRPSFISASTAGVGSRDDIAILLLAFMINHGIAINALNQISFLPADIAADNIAAIFKQRQIGACALHVTVDGYYNMINITRLITRNYGYRFVYYDIPSFVAEMKRRCTRDDPLYPLLEFFTRSHLKIAAMQHKRYNNDQYREARRLSSNARGDPPLEDTVSYLMDYMLREDMIPCADHSRAAH